MKLNPYMQEFSMEQYLLENDPDLKEHVGEIDTETIIKKSDQLGYDHYKLVGDELLNGHLIFIKR